jgi:hypothetical protein
VSVNSEPSVAEPVLDFGPAKQMLRRIASSQLLMWLALVCLFTTLPLMYINHKLLNDPDIWWHMRAGEWILQNHQIPHADPFSSTTLGRPWVEYCWVFDIGSYWLVRRFDLVGIIWFQTLLRLALAATLFSLVRSLMPQFWRAFAVTGLAILAMAWSLPPRPGAFSVLFFVLELYVLVSAQRRSNPRLLWMLPPLFLLWANIHVEFVNGLFMLGVFCIEPLLDKLLIRASQTGTIFDRFHRQLCFVGIASFLAVLINPYGPQLLTNVWRLASDTKIYDFVIEFHAMYFRTVNDWAVLALLMLACFALGRSRSFRPSWAVLLAWSAWMGFRSLREVWLIAILSAVIVARLQSEYNSDVEHGPIPEKSSSLNMSLRVAVAVTVLLVLIAGASVWSLTSKALLGKVAEVFPVGAVSYIHRNHLQGPLLNEFTWGGFLIYTVPEIPPSMDGRTNVHTQSEILAASSLWNGEPGWDKRPELQSANLVLSNHSWPLASLLRNDPRFRVVYEDRTSVLFEAVHASNTNNHSAPQHPPS